MGSKRSYDSQEPLQLPCKYLKQSESDEKLISYADERLAPIASVLPSIESIDKPNIPAGRNGFKASRLVDPFEFVIHEVRNVVDKGLVDGRRFPWITDSYGNGDGDGDMWCRDFQRSFSPDCFHSNSPRRAPVNVRNALSSFLDRCPRKQVPIGANYQADLAEDESPEAGSSGGCVLNSDQVLISDEEKLLMGTCVIPMPDTLPAQNSLSAGTGRKDCECVDNASVRCVRQHVKEARDKLVKALGEDTFRELGFLDMGEEVAHIWSKEEEQVFHEVVFSNPASRGRDFWSCLSEEFPTRSYRDLVSYYFNVFMLRKRAAQNRSRFLDIDSDDDEWHPCHGRSYSIGSADDNDDKSTHDDDSSKEGHYSENDDVENTHYSGEEESPQLNLRFLHEERNSFTVNHDDSWTFLELQSGMNNNTSTKPCLPTKDLNGIKNQNEYKNSSPDQTESGDGLHSESSDDSNNFGQWNQGFSASLDHLLPTHDMIEEIFGPGSWDNSPNHD